ncbi:MAG: isoprenylcysteine carboxylmethyltransferase family protein [Chloroflexi bacterium]|nr:isoprenylcysteine carboxylmethyltransferase family protein [Chloroflexota bacterium]
MAESIFRAAFWLLLGSIFVMRAYFSYRVHRAGERLLPDRAAVEREGRGAFAVRFVLFFVLLAFLALYTLDVPWLRVLAIPLPSWLRWLGFALGVASVILWTWTQATLGTQWSAQLQLREDHRLVTTGPYARVRHPLYTAMFGVSVAFALVTANWAFVLFGVLCIVGMLVRVPREECMMLDEFGAEYASYMQQTGRFFPRVSRSGR